VSPSGKTALAALALLAGCADRAHFDRERYYAARLISHELGALDGNYYLSCRECFEHSYAQGLRYLEADLMQASDGRIVASHDGEEKRFDLPPGFTSAQFMSKKILGRYTPLDGRGLAALLKEKRDWYLIGDIKTDVRTGLIELCKELGDAGIDCRERVVPQITRPQDLIYALYRSPKSVETIVKAVEFAKANPEIVDVLIPLDWWDELGHTLLGDAPEVRIYVHTVNSAVQADALFAHGVTGIYTDSLAPGSADHPTR
jgi:glycerophosphoryl diester phosphodiesterase